jgi:hypothetical protein
LQKPAGFTDKNGYIAISFRGKHLLAHRLAFLFQTGVLPEHQLDHINGDRADNRWSNLRPATNAENSQNRKKTTQATSQYIGVSWHKRMKKWQSEIRVNGKQIYLGSFSNEHDAALAYNTAKQNLHLFQPVSPKR